MQLRRALLSSSRAAAQPSKQTNMVSAINDALRIALETNPAGCFVFGEDVAFGGVFRCTHELRAQFGPHRVFNTPLCEQGIVGFGVGLASMGKQAVAEIQFADYIFPAFDQIVNEAAKFRFRSGGQYDCGGLTIRAPYGAVGHGALYHSQSPEAYFSHCPGLRIVVPRGPKQAKGLLLASIRSRDPVLFLEPKALYRAGVGMVPEGDYELELGKAEVTRPGSDVTVVGYGAQMIRIHAAAARAESELGLSVEAIDLQSIAPWDSDAVCASVSKTGRLVVSHEAPLTSGFAAEVAATVQDRCFLHLEAPIQRVCGWDTPFPLVYEKAYLPSAERILQAIQRAAGY